jgi:hypothetical protein
MRKQTKLWEDCGQNERRKPVDLDSLGTSVQNYFVMPGAADPFKRWIQWRVSKHKETRLRTLLRQSVISVLLMRKCSSR